MSKFDKGWRGDHKHKIMPRPFMAKYGTLSQVFLKLVVARSQPCTQTLKWAPGACVHVFSVGSEKFYPQSTPSLPFAKMASADGAKWMKDNLGT